MCLDQQVQYGVEVEIWNVQCAMQSPTMYLWAKSGQVTEGTRPSWDIESVDGCLTCLHQIVPMYPETVVLCLRICSLA